MEDFSIMLHDILGVNMYDVLENILEHLSGAKVMSDNDLRKNIELYHTVLLNDIPDTEEIDYQQYYINCGYMYYRLLDCLEVAQGYGAKPNNRIANVGEVLAYSCSPVLYPNAQVGRKYMGWEE